MATIRLRDVTKVFPRLESSTRGRPTADGHDSKNGGVALNGVDLTVFDGQTLAVVGPSGCGKSTLLRVVAGLETEYDGTVTFDGRDMRDVAPKDRHIGMVFQNYALYPHFEGQGNLSFFFKMRRAPDKETEERIRATADMMGLGFDELLPRKPGTLSGGQQQRLAIARALVRSPDLFLFDEPLSNLDAKLRAQTRVEVKRLLRRFQTTAIYVTHDQTEAITLGDRIAIMREGHIEQVGGFQELLRYPLNTFVAGFLGLPPMNLLSGCLADDGTLRADSVIVSVPSHIADRVRVGERLTLGVRPEAASLAGEAPQPAGDLELRGEVVAVEPDFAHRTQVVYLQHGSLSFAARLDLTPDILIGDVVVIRFPAEDLIFFDHDEHRLN